MNFLKRLITALVAFFILGNSAFASTATVDFSTPINVNNMSGFLNGNIGASYPLTSTINPLKPAWWRLGPENSGSGYPAYNRALLFGAKPIVTISDGYGYPLNNWNGNPAPYSDNNATLVSYITTLVTGYKNAGYHPVYDIWNEPDTQSWNVPQFWDGTQAQYFSLYVAAFNAILAADSQAKIIGPSYANYDQTNETLWLNNLYKNGIYPDYMAWHELSQADFNIPSVQTDIQHFKSLVHGYPGWKRIRFLIPESVGPNTHLSPGDILAFLYYIEASGADGACKACWNAADTTNNCFNGSIDGIVQETSDHSPRAAWWAYKTYADGVGNRVATTTSDPNLVVLAAKSTPAQVLLGYSGQSSPTPTSVTITLNRLDKAGITGGNVKIDVYKVPDSGESTVSALTSVSSSTVAVTSNSASLTISGINVHEEYALYLSNP